MNKRDIAGYLGINRTTLYNWERERPNLYKTIMKGLAFDDFVEQSQKHLDKIKELSDKDKK